MSAPKPGPAHPVNVQPSEKERDVSFMAGSDQGLRRAPPMATIGPGRPWRSGDRHESSSGSSQNRGRLTKKDQLPARPVPASKRPVRVKLRRINCDYHVSYAPESMKRDWWARLKEALGTASPDFVAATLSLGIEECLRKTEKARHHQSTGEMPRHATVGHALRSASSTQKAARARRH